MFQQQPALRYQVLRGLTHDGLEGGQAVATGTQGLRRLVSQSCEVRVVRRDIGRVADHQIEAPPLQRLPPVAGQELDCQAVVCGIGARHGQRLGTQVDGADLDVRPVRA